MTIMAAGADDDLRVVDALSPASPETVFLATCAGNSGLGADDRTLLNALRGRGIDARPAVWEDHFVDWEDAGAVVIRSTWDYTYRRPDFLTWAERVSDQTPLFNPADVVRWNTHKSYLVDFAESGMHVVPTIFLERGAEADLGALMDEYGWDPVVVKPAVAASGRTTVRVGRTDARRAQRLLPRHLEHEDMLVQPYMEAVASAGETSVMIIDDEVTHAVCKRPSKDEFRVQPEHGGTCEAVPVDDELRGLAAEVVETVDEDLLYARVDVAKDADGRWCLMELELVEPELFFRHDDKAMKRMCDALERVLDRS